jgi:integrase
MATIATDREVNTAKAVGGRPTDFPVKGAPGLRLRVMASGFKSWSFIFTRTTDGKKRRVRLGEYPVMGLKDAKTEAQRLHSDVGQGKDPAAARQEARGALTFAKLAADYLERHAKVKKRSWAEDERMLNYDLLPALGHLRADAITKREVLDVLNAKAHDGGAGHMANRLRSLVLTIFNWGMGEDLIAINPAAGIKPRIKEEARERTLTVKEMRRFWHGLDDASMTDGLRDVLRLALLSGQRVNEIAGAEDVEFDWQRGIWTIPGGRTKNKRVHVVPLSPLALSMFTAAFTRSGQRFAFPGKTAAGGPIGETAATRAWGRARDALELGDVHIHDLRRTFATGLGDMDHNDFDVGLCLNHQSARSPITGKHYNQAAYVEKKRHLFEAWETRLMAIVEGREVAANVVPLRGAGAL